MNKELDNIKHLQLSLPTPKSTLPETSPEMSAKHIQPIKEELQKLVAHKAMEALTNTL